MQLNILEARANSRFYRGLLKLKGMHSATGSQGYTILLALLYLGCVYVGFRYGQAVFILVTHWNLYLFGAFGILVNFDDKKIRKSQ